MEKYLNVICINLCRPFSSFVYNVFPFTAAGVIRGYMSLYDLSREAALEYPERVTSTNLRKYFATLTQVFYS